MNITIFGLSITSSWGNGHATTFRALCRALAARGRQVTFYEQNAEWYVNNRDLPNPEYCKLITYDSWSEIRERARRAMHESDVAVVGSYFPNGIQAIDDLLASNAKVKAFYDIDTPITITQLRERGATEYLRADQVRGFDVYFSFTGGPMLREIESRFGAPMARPLYCSFDPDQYRWYPPHKRYTCDLSYMGTYAPDRQPKLEEFLLKPALDLPQRRFIVAGPQYPRDVKWPKNVGRIQHLNPRWHPRLYSSSRLTLNVTRRDMVMAGYSPSVRLFEAAACRATIVSDNWPGLDSFFRPGSEILLPADSNDVIRYITGYDDAQLLRIGEAAQARVLSEHTSDRRAQEFEEAAEAAMNGLATTARRAS